jgi:hemin uptake protein HemP
MNSGVNGQTTSPSREAVSSAHSSPVNLPRVNVETLLAGGRELVIVHHEEEYHLRITKKGRLLLTK